MKPYPHEKELVGAFERKQLERWKSQPSDIMPLHVKAKYKELRYKVPHLEFLLEKFTHRSPIDYLLYKATNVDMR